MSTWVTAGISKRTWLRRSIPKSFFVFFRNRMAPILTDVGNDEHVGAVAIELEPLGYVFPASPRGGRRGDSAAVAC
jgi:hypothetical protein